jgi:type IV pilus assembly protein PilA
LKGIKVLALQAKENNESGFTLIEILVVVLIIGILTAIAIPVFLNQRRQALDAQLKSDIKTVATWLETNKVKNSDAAYARLAKSWATPGATTNLANWPSDLVISKNTGIITSDSGSSAAYFGGVNGATGAGFCIEGQVSNSNFDLLASDTPQRMWYSSLKGGFTDSCRL